MCIQKHFLYLIRKLVGYFFHSPSVTGQKQKVAVAGDFNDWDPDMQLTRERVKI